MPQHDVFLVQLKNTFCNEHTLTGGVIDFAKVRTLLFDMPQRKYWKLGEPVANCWSEAVKLIKSYVLISRVLNGFQFEVIRPK